MPVSIGLPQVKVTRVLDQAQGAPANVEVLELMLHSGTHVDAPFHFVPGGSTVAEVDASALSGSGVVVDVPGDRGWTEITAERLTEWERHAGETIGESDAVLLRTGHSALWAPLPEGIDYMTMGWPYLGSSAIDLLLERRVKVVGVECPDPDKTDQNDLATSTFEAHRRLLGAGVLIIETLAHLADIPVPRFDFLALALPIEGASGSPIRALALLPAPL